MTMHKTSSHTIDSVHIKGYNIAELTNRHHNISKVFHIQRYFPYVCPTCKYQEIVHFQKRDKTNENVIKLPKHVKQYCTYQQSTEHIPFFRLGTHQSCRSCHPFLTKLLRDRHMNVLGVRGPPDTNDYSLHCSHYSPCELQFKIKLFFKKFNTSTASKTICIQVEAR